MEFLIGGAVLGAVFTSLFPGVSDSINGLMKPVSKGVFTGLHAATTSAMTFVSETGDTVKDLWSEAHAEADAKRRQAATVVDAVGSASLVVPTHLDVVDERKK